MALSGSTTVTATTRSNGSAGDQLQFSWTATQSVTDNTSTVSWTLTLVSLDYGKIESTASKSWSVTVNGTKYSGTNTIGIASNATKTLASGSTTISHNSDGTKSFSYSFSQEFSITFNSWVGTVSGSGSATLDTIARASSFSAVSGTEIGGTCSVTISRASSSFTHQLWYKVGSSSWYDLGSGIGTSTSFTIALETCSQYPSATSGTMQLCLRTYSGSTQIGSDVYKSVTVTIPDSVAPTCTVSVTDAAGYADTYGGYLVGLSKMQVTVTATTAYSSEIKTYSISANGETGTATPYTTGTVKTAGTNTVSATVTDARGRKGTASTTVTALAYTAPQLTISVHRCTSDGTEDMTGGYIKVSYTGSVTTLSGKNSAQSLTLKYKKSADSSYTSTSLSTSSLDSSTVFEADTGSSYDVSVTLADKLSSVTKTTSASTAGAIMHFGADGDRMGIGKVAETAGLDIGWDTLVRGALEADGAATLGSTLDVTGAATLGSTLDVTGAATLDSTLNVSGAAAFDGRAKFNGAVRGRTGSFNIYLHTFQTGSGTTITVTMGSHSTALLFGDYNNAYPFMFLLSRASAVNLGGYGSVSSSDPTHTITLRAWSCGIAIVIDAGGDNVTITGG